MPFPKTALYLFTISFILLSPILSAQKAVKQIPIELKTGNSSEVLSVVDNDKNIHLFYFDRDKITHVELNENYEFLWEKKHAKPKRPFNKIGGYSVSADNSINLYFTNAARNKFLLFSLNNDNDLSISNIELSISKEKELTSINHDNKFHLLTFNKNSSVLHRYTFDKATSSKFTYDLSAEKFYNYDNKQVPLASILKSNEHRIIDSEVPASIEDASKKIKIYLQKNKLILALNHRRSATRILELSTTTEEVKPYYFPISTFAFGNSDYFRSNSFLHSNKIYQLISSSHLLNFSIYNLESGKKIKEYSFTSDDEIPFKNSPIYQEGSAYSSNTRELDRTKQFLRKITNSSVGLTVLEKNGRLNIKIGGVTQMGGGAPMMLPMAGIPVASFGAVTMTINPTFYAFGSYGSTRSVYIKSVFNSEDLEHIPGDPFTNLFDKIKEYEDTLDLHYLTTLFHHKGSFVYGHYNRKSKEYLFKEFLP